MSSPTGRFAPSPTGDLHLGNARTALLAWLQARSLGGSFVLRMEDLDPGRSRREFVERQLDDLRWLGLDWDEGPDVGGKCGPYFQSGRGKLYAKALDRLRELGLLFECRCSRKEIAAAASAPHPGEEEGPPYPGTCVLRSPDQRVAEGRHALRMRVQDGSVCFPDLVMGERCFDPARETGAFVVRRKDGVAAYQLAVVVDDAAMGISHVLRGADLLSSTARQILIYRALELPEPAWAHVPLLLGPDGERLSKRHGKITLREFREAGISPERVIGWLAWSCGMGEGATAEITARRLIPTFSPDQLPTQPTVVERLPFL